MKEVERKYGGTKYRTLCGPRPTDTDWPLGLCLGEHSKRLERLIEAAYPIFFNSPIFAQMTLVSVLFFPFFWRGDLI